MCVSSTEHYSAVVMAIQMSGCSSGASSVLCPPSGIREEKDDLSGIIL